MLLVMLLVVAAAVVSKVQQVFIHGLTKQIALRLLVKLRLKLRVIIVARGEWVLRLSSSLVLLSALLIVRLKVHHLQQVVIPSLLLRLVIDLSVLDDSSDVDDHTGQLLRVEFVLVIDVVLIRILVLLDLGRVTRSDVLCITLFVIIEVLCRVSIQLVELRLLDVVFIASIKVLRSLLLEEVWLLRKLVGCD